MRESECDILIVGGGTGGCAAAIAAVSLGMRVVLTEETCWLGGQLTSQAVPPDEHPWIEQFGCTALYRQYRNLVRQFYRDRTPLLPLVAREPTFNPGGGWVSNLCHEPRIGLMAIQTLLQTRLASGKLDVRLQTVASGGAVLSSKSAVSTGSQRATDGDRIKAIELTNLVSGEREVVHAKFFVDATEIGDLLALSGTEFVTGAESKEETGEEHAVEGPAQPENMQAVTWVFAMAHDQLSHRVIDRPESYGIWKSFQPSFWPGPLLAMEDLNPQSLQKRHLPLFSEGWRCWFKYRQVVDPSHFEAGYSPHPVTIVNWPQNDYFLEPIVEATAEERADRLNQSKELSLSLLYWLQTECPRPDGGCGYPGLYLRPDITGTADGFAMTPYIRESRRIVARHTIVEQDVAATSPNQERATEVKNSVGIGAYRIDLHPSTGGDNYVDLSTAPFQIPLGSLVPIRMRNLLPACKNLGSTHITNGCYRLHPVEWNIGESAGALAAFCVTRQLEPAQVLEIDELTQEFQKLLVSRGVEIQWPRLKPL